MDHFKDWTRSEVWKFLEGVRRRVVRVAFTLPQRHRDVVTFSVHRGLAEASIPPDSSSSEVKTKVNSLLYVKSRFCCTTKVIMCIACMLGNHLQKANLWFLKLLPTCPKAKLILAARAAD